MCLLKHIYIKHTHLSRCAIGLNGSKGQAMIRQMDPPCPYFIVEIEPVVARSIYLPDRYRRREEDYLHVHVPTLFSLPSPPSLLLLMNPNLYPQSLSLSLSLITPSFPSPFSLIYCSLLSAFCIPIPNPVLSISHSVFSFHSPYSPHSPHSPHSPYSP